VYNIASSLEVDVYLAFGEYTLDAPLQLTAGVSVFGSFKGIKN
jgi:hypothetical protein